MNAVEMFGFAGVVVILVTYVGNKLNTIVRELVKNEGMAK